MLTAEITNNLYQNFLTLNQGFSLANNGAWLLLLNKVMGMVAEFKSSDLTRDDRIDLVVAVVMRYLDEKTELPDNQLQHITTSVRAMCVAMLGYGGELAGKQPIARIPNDPELVNTPLRITQLLMDKMQELVRRDPKSTENLGQFLPQIVMLCITTINKFRNLTNLEKRNLVVDVINSFLDEYLAPRLATNSAQQLSLALFKSDLGNMVDLFVGIAKGKSEYNFNYKDPVGRRNLLACIGTGFVRGVALLGLCFSRANTTTDTTTDTTTALATTSADTNQVHENNTFIAESVDSTPDSKDTDSNNTIRPSVDTELHTIMEEVDANTSQEETEKKEEHTEAKNNSLAAPISEIEPVNDEPNAVELVQVIIDTMASTNTDLDLSSDV